MVFAGCNGEKKEAGPARISAFSPDGSHGWEDYGWFIFGSFSLLETPLQFAGCIPKHK
jgi:hypothetical protein